MLVKCAIAGVMTAAVVITSAQIKFPPKPKVFYNPSSSADIGWYKLRPDIAPEIGVQVAAYAPDWARRMADERQYLPYEYPLIKTVVAVEGDEVCYHKTSVSVPNGSVITLQVRDRLGRDMPRQSVGCIVLKPDEYYLVSPDVQNGFDSRYFGAVSSVNILGAVEYLGKRDSQSNIESVGFGGIEG